ncbi:hypothetical protein C443_00012 [Haloarcula argentinensis DSM 12282]|nr:hypothetical protein C443_00012 [Haloarcula argentinensis DSM 12282]
MLLVSHRCELFSGVGQIFDYTLMGSKFTDNRLESINDSRNITVKFMLTVRATVLPAMLHLRQSETEIFEI